MEANSTSASQKPTNNASCPDPAAPCTTTNGGSNDEPPKDDGYQLTPAPEALEGDCIKIDRFPPASDSNPSE